VVVLIIFLSLTYDTYSVAIQHPNRIQLNAITLLNYRVSSSIAYAQLHIIT